MVLISNNDIKNKTDSQLVTTLYFRFVWLFFFVPILLFFVEVPAVLAWVCLFAIGILPMFISSKVAVKKYKLSDKWLTRLTLLSTVIAIIAQAGIVFISSLLGKDSNSDNNFNPIAAFEMFVLLSLVAFGLYMSIPFYIAQYLKQKRIK